MKYILTLNIKYCRFHFKHILQILLVYTICVMLLVIQGLTAYSFLNSVKENQLCSNGIQDAVLIDCDIDKINEKLSIKQVGEIINFAKVNIEEALYNNVLQVGYIDDSAIELHHIQLIEGKMPENKNEIAIEKSALSILRNKLNIGDKLKLSLETQDGNKISDANFKVVGILNDFSDSQWKLEEESKIPNAFLSKEFYEQFNCASAISILSIKSTVPIEQLNNLLSDLMNKGFLSNYYINDESSQTVSINQYAALASGIVVLISGVLCVALLLNTNAGTKIKRKQDIGLYRISEMNFFEINLCFLFRYLPYMLIACFLGSTIGSYIVEKLLLKINIGIDYSFNPYIVLGACCFIMIFTFILQFVDICKAFRHTVIEDINQIKNKPSIQDIKTNIKNPNILWAWKSYNFNKSSSVTISLLILVCIVVSTIGGASIQYINKMISMRSPADIVISAYNGSTNLIGIADDPLFGLTLKDYNYLIQSDDLDSYIALQEIPFNIKDSVENIIRDNTIPWNSKEYKEQLKKFDYSDDTILYPEYILGADEDTLERLKTQKNISGIIDIEALNSAKEVVVCNAGGHFDFYNVGDKIRLTQVINNQKVEFDVIIGAIINFESQNYLESMEALAFGDRIIIGQKSFEKLGIDKNINSLYINIKNINEINDIDIRLNSINENYKNFDDNYSITINENFQKAEQYRFISRIFNITYQLIIAIILIFIIISSIISQSIRFNQHKKVFAAMRAIGMSNKDLFFITLIERFCQFAFAIFLGTFVSVVFIIIFNQEMGMKLVSFPITPYIITIGIMLIAIVIISYYPVYKFFKRKEIATLLK